MTKSHNNIGKYAVHECNPITLSMNYKRQLAQMTALYKIENTKTINVKGNERKPLKEVCLQETTVIDMTRLF